MWPDAPASLRQPIRPSALCLPEISSAACTLRIWRRPGSLPRTKRTVCLILLTAVGSGLRTQAALQIENAALQPDLQGNWTLATFTPLQRPEHLGEKEFYTEEEPCSGEVARAHPLRGRSAKTTSGS